MILQTKPFYCILLESMHRKLYILKCKNIHDVGVINDCQNNDNGFNSAMKTMPFVELLRKGIGTTLWLFSFLVRGKKRVIAEA